MQSQTRLAKRLSDVALVDLAHFVVFAVFARRRAHYSLELASRLLDMFAGVIILRFLHETLYTPICFGFRFMVRAVT